MRVCYLLLLLALSASAHAHRFAPSLLQLTESGADRVAVTWKTPIEQVSDIPMEPELPGSCTVQEQSLPDGRPLIRYSGSPLRYSLSEADHEKSATIVDLDADGTCTIDVVPLPQPAGMARLRGSLDELLSGAYAQHRNDFVERTNRGDNCNRRKRRKDNGEEKTKEIELENG